MSNLQYSAHGCYLLGGICWFNDWRADVESWMKEEKLPSYYLFLERAANGEKVCYQKAHCMVRSGFSSYCHHLAGCKYLLHMLLQLPILAQCSATTRLWCSCRSWYQLSQNGSLICNEISKLKNPKRRCGNQSRRSPPTTVVA